MTTVIASPRVVRLAWDSTHFGVAVGRLENPASPAGLDAALATARAEGIRLVVARLEAADLESVQRLERAGFRLADTLVRYERVLDRGARTHARTAVAIRPARVDDVAALERVAREAFQGYAGHFRNDPALDPSRGDEVYVRWAANACRETPADAAMFVAERGHAVVGFGLVVTEGEVAEGALYAVAQAARGDGVGAALLDATLGWAQDRGLRRMTVYSSIANPSAHRVWIRGGFTPAGGLHTLHGWLG